MTEIWCTHIRVYCSLTDIFSKFSYNIVLLFALFLWDWLEEKQQQLDELMPTRDVRPNSVIAQASSP